MKETVFYIVGIALAVSAIVVSFIGLKSEKFPGKASVVVILIFAVGAIGAGTFAVLYSKEHEEHREHELEHANEVNEGEAHGEPDKEAVEDDILKEDEEGPGGSEEGGGPVGSAEQGEQVFTSAGCASCHTFAAAGSTGVTGPNLDESIASDDDKKAIEEMIVDPEKEVVPGYSAGIMPSTFGESLSEEEVASLVEFIYVNSAAGKGA
jgi:hypothetical protein